MHGYAIAQRIQQRSEDVLVVEEGSLYPCLYRMEEKGWIAAEWGKSENNRRAKYYSLTRAVGGNWRRRRRFGTRSPRHHAGVADGLNPDSRGDENTH